MRNDENEATGYLKKGQVLQYVTQKNSVSVGNTFVNPFNVVFKINLWKSVI